MQELEQTRDDALRALRNGEWSEAARLYRLRLEMQDDQADEATAEDVTNLGALLRKLGRLVEAVEHYQIWVPRLPEHQQLRLNGINCLIEVEDLALAEAWAIEGLDLNVKQPGFELALARIKQKQGCLTQCRDKLAALSKKYPEMLGIWLEFAQVCQRLGDLPAAIFASERALQVDPKCYPAWGNQILLLKQLGELERANQLIESLPYDIRSHVEVRRAIANLWMEQQLMAEAEAEFAALCQFYPEEASHWLNRAACLRNLKHFHAAAAVLKGGIKWAPKETQLQESLGHCLAEMGEPGRGTHVLRNCLSWSRLEDQSHASLQFIGAGYRTLRPVERKTLAVDWENRKQAEGVGPLWRDRIRRAIGNRRLRVGYLSSDFCNHPVGRFLLPVLQGHDRQTMEIWGLACGPHNDATTDEIRKCCDHWLDIRFGHDLEIARLIADQDLDILIELGGYTGHSRIGALVHRPAPVQMSYLGYFAPTYLKAIDGWIGDKILFGNLCKMDKEVHKLVEIEGGYMCFQENEQVEPKRAENIPFRFGSFNHSRKLSNEAIRLFCDVVKAVPGAELVLKSISFVEELEQRRIRQLFESQGLAPEKLVILDWIEGRKNHLDCYRYMDVALDPTPYGGATTTCEALWMGVPVITLSGQDMVQQLSSSILHSAGLEQWIAKDHNHYVEIATRIAGQGKRYATDRGNLRTLIQRSQLCDKTRISRELEFAYRSALDECLDATS